MVLSDVQDTAAEAAAKNHISMTLRIRQRAHVCLVS